MSPKTGRPLKGESKKDIRLQLRLNREEIDLIEECAARTGKNRTEVIISGVQMLKSKLDAKKE